MLPTKWSHYVDLCKCECEKNSFDDKFLVRNQFCFFLWSSEEVRAVIIVFVILIMRFYSKRKSQKLILQLGIFSLSALRVIKNNFCGVVFDKLENALHLKM
jgi:hypothetical protein